MAKGNLAKQFVYRQHGDDTHLVAMPRYDPDRQPTEKQETVRNTFGNAVAYAKWAIAEPDLKLIYDEKAGRGKSAFNIAIRDFAKPPVVTLLNVQEYTGAPGSQIIVQAKDDVRVTQVRVRITNAAGELLEEGDTVLNMNRKTGWVYTAQLENIQLAGCKISATALDLPGNTGTLEVTL